MKKAITAIAAVLVLLAMLNVNTFAVGNSVEAMYEDGMEYFERRDYDRAFARFQISGEVREYAPSQNMLGVCYRDGLGTEQDIETAKRFFELSAEQNYRPALDNLAALQEQQAGESAGDSEGQPYKGKKEKSDDVIEREKSKVPNLLSIDLDSNNPVLAWEAVEGADSYTVYRRAYLKKYSKLITTEDTGFEDKTCDTGIKYFYRIRAGFPDGIWSEYSNQLEISISGEGVPGADIPEITAISLNDKKNIVIKWTENGETDEYYRIYWAKDSTKERDYQYLGTSGKNNFTTGNYTEGAVYSFKVQKQLPGGKWSEFSQPWSIEIPLAEREGVVPHIKLIRLNEEGYPILEWETVKDADMVQILRSKDDQDGFTYISTSKRNIYADKSVESGQTYFYKIRAKFSDRSWSEFSEVISITIP